MYLEDAPLLEQRLAGDAAAGARLEDLVAVLIGDDAARTVAVSGGLWPLLERREPPDLALDTRVRLEALRELLLRLSRETRPVGQTIREPMNIVRRFSHLATLDHEQFHVLALDAKHRVVASRCLGVGGIASVTVEMADLLRFVLEARAVALALVHNHPSGDPTPSAADRDLTRACFAAATQLGLRALDHVIVGAGEAFSFTEERVFCY
jgi:DNA repair protein RadC